MRRARGGKEDKRSKTIMKRKIGTDKRQEEAYIMTRE